MVPVHLLKEDLLMAVVMPEGVALLMWPGLLTISWMWNLKGWTNLDLLILI